MNYAPHPIAEIFPLLNETELQELADDIKAQGLLNPIILEKETNLIIDGRNRWKACELVKVEPECKYFAGESVLNFVIAQNLKRRHLTTEQRAVAAQESLPFFKEEAKKRQQAHGGTAPGKSLSQQIGQVIDPHESRASTQAAKAFGSNRNHVELVQKLKTKDPGAYEALKQGKKKIADLQREEKQKKRIDRAEQLSIGPFPEGKKYSVIYCDPPWRYDDTHTTNAAENHYLTMSVEELSALPVADLTADDCVLFCWATAPLLPEALEVIRAWKFTYKTLLFIWSKIKPNFGHYHNCNAELLLVCTKGSATPFVDKRESQVQTIERTERHSAKPEQFRQMIDRLYPTGPRVELFRRGDAPRGWDVWGDETKKEIITPSIVSPDLALDARLEKACLEIEQVVNVALAKPRSKPSKPRSKPSRANSKKHIPIEGGIAA